MKRKTVLLIIIFALFSSAVILAISFVNETPISNEFDSEVRLSNWDFDPEVNDEEFYSNMKVQLITVAKGSPIYSWFGHSAIAIVPPDKDGYMFDYGVFSFSSDFYKNFALGRLWYKVLASYRNSEMERFKEDKRTVYCIDLKLSPEKKKACADFLTDNIKQENQNYLYHNFVDNCSTRDRDIINYLTDGDFKNWAISQPGITFRKQENKILDVNPLVNWLFNFVLSGYVDKPTTLWEDMYIPEVLHNAVVDYGKITENNFIEVDAQTTNHRIPTYSKYSFFRELLIPVLMSLMVAFLIIYFKKTKSRVGFGITVFIVDLIFGLISLILIFMMLFTNHNYSYFNENIIFINPYLLILAFKGLSITKNRTSLVYKFEKNNKIMFFISLILVFLKLLLPQVFYQGNWPQIIPMLIIFGSCGFFGWEKENLPSFEKVN